MHSIREVCGSRDLKPIIQLFTAFFNEYPRVNRAIGIDNPPVQGLKKRRRKRGKGEGTSEDTPKKAEEQDEAEEQKTTPKTSEAEEPQKAEPSAKPMSEAGDTKL